MLFHFFGAEAVAEQEHQLRHGAFGGDVVTAHNACLQQPVSGFVAVHFHRTGPALGDVDDDQAPADGVFQPVQKPSVARRVAAAEGFHHHAFQTGDMQDAFHHLGRDAGKELQNGDVPVEQVVGFERTAGYGPVDMGRVVFDGDAGVGQHGIIVGAESVEVVGADFAGTIAPEQVVFEEDAYFGYDGLVVFFGGGYLDGGDEVFFSVGAEHADGQLRAGQDDGLAQVFEHEAEGGSGIGHRVGTVQDDKAVVIMVIFGDDAYDLLPGFGAHFGRVHRRVELQGGHLAAQFVEFGNVFAQMLKIKGFERACFGVAYHADGSSGVDQ